MRGVLCLERRNYEVSTYSLPKSVIARSALSPQIGIISLLTAAYKKIHT